MATPVKGPDPSQRNVWAKALVFLSHPKTWGRGVSLFLGYVKQKILLLGSSHHFAVKRINGRNVTIDKRTIEHKTHPELAQAQIGRDKPFKDAEAAGESIGRELGTGSFAITEEVYPAKGEAGPVGVRKRPKASKVVGRYNQAASLAKEFDLLSKLNHPRIVKVSQNREREFHPGNDCLYMQHGGVPLSALKKETLNAALTQKCVKQMLEGLLYLKEQKVVHKDIKPDNVLVDQGGDIRFIDFGLAEELGDSGVSHVARGTPLYMAPEMMKHPAEFGVAADVFSAACVIYELVTGETFKGEEPNDMGGQMRLLHAGFPFDRLWDVENNLHRLNPDLPEEFIKEISSLLKSMLDPKPDSRITPEDALRHPFLTKNYGNQS